MIPYNGYEEKHERKTHVSSHVFKHNGGVTKVKHRLKRYFRESVVLQLNAAVSITLT